MIIKVLGTGCPKCKLLYATVESAIQELGLDAIIQKVEDMGKILEYDLMATPGLVIDEKLVIAGKVPSTQELVNILSNIINYKQESNSKSIGGSSCGGDC